MKPVCEPYFSADKPEFSPSQYAIDSGWDFSHIEATARLGVSDTDRDNLRAYYGPGRGERAAEALVAYCRERVRP